MLSNSILCAFAPHDIVHGGTRHQGWRTWSSCGLKRGAAAELNALRSGRWLKSSRGGAATGAGAAVAGRGAGASGHGARRSVPRQHAKPQRRVSRQKKLPRPSAVRGRVTKFAARGRVR